MSDKLKEIELLIDSLANQAWMIGNSPYAYSQNDDVAPRAEFLEKKKRLTAAIADLVTKWVPVSEPPEKSCRVLLTLEMQNQRAVVEGVYSPALGFEYWDEDGASKDLFPEASIAEDESDYVSRVAWQPLPAPYEGQA
jgi:hypothetical protein